MLKLHEIIREPMLTERSTLLKEVGNIYVFKVHIDATKKQIGDAIFKYFNVRPLKVRTSLMRGKVKQMARYQSKRSNWKKAFVSVKAGETINIIEGL